MNLKSIMAMGLVFLTWTAVFSAAKLTTKSPAQVQDRVINFKIPLSKTSQIIYAIRYSQVMDAKTANELADMMVNQVNDTVLNKAQVPPKPPVKQK